MRSKSFIVASLSVAFAILACSPATPRPVPARSSVAESDAKAPSASPPTDASDARVVDAGIPSANEAPDAGLLPGPRGDGTFFAARVTDVTGSGDAGAASADDIKAIEHTLSRRMHALEACHLRLPVGKEGRIRVELSLGNGVRDRDVRVVESSLTDAPRAFASCITTAIDDMVFDQYLSAPLRARATVMFSAAPDPAIASGVRVRSKIARVWASSSSYGQSLTELHDALAAATPRFTKCHAKLAPGTSRTVPLFLTLDWGPGTGGWSKVEVDLSTEGDAGADEFAWCVYEAFRRPRFGHHISAHVTVEVSFEPVSRR